VLGQDHLGGASIDEPFQIRLDRFRDKHPWSCLMM